MRRADNKEDSQYERIEIFEDDLIIPFKSPQIVACSLINKHNFKLKDTMPVSFHLGYDFTRDSNNELCLAPRKHTDKMTEFYVSIFGSKPK